MKNVLFLLSLVFSVVAFAAPTISVTSVTQNPDTRTVTIAYAVGGESAVVTLESITAGGEAVSAADLRVVSGDVNRLVTAGNHTLTWQPSDDLGFGPFAAGAVSVGLKAWSVDNPPDYLVIDLEFSDRVRYYASADDIPGGLSDNRYKTDYLVLRKIPAAGVEWRMGTDINVRPWSWSSPQGSAGLEPHHYVKLTNDFYMAVYETTLRQAFWFKNRSMPTDAFANYGGDWNWPSVGNQFCVLRGWFHEANCSYLAGLADKYADDTAHKFWPHDGHDIDAVNAPACSACMGGSKKTSVLARMRDLYGFQFDLPTEAEWEFASRGESSKQYYNGSDVARTDMLDANLDAIGWYFYNSSNETYNCCLPHPVGLKQPNKYGLYDMLGNVSEFCLDYVGNLPNTTEVSVAPVGAVPTANIRGNNVVRRGGCFSNQGDYTYAGCRRSKSTQQPTSNSDGTKSEAGPVRGENHGYRVVVPCRAVK